MDNVKLRFNELKDIIKTKIQTIDQKYRFGPSLYYYQKVIEHRRIANNINDFLINEKNIEYLYGALLAWDMNSRGAKMKYFTDFKNSIVKNKMYFFEIENHNTNILNIELGFILNIIKVLYQNLDIMYTKARLVSTSKLLHFMFPDLMMPMDRRNTLKYFFGNETESLKRFLEIFEFSYYFSKENIQWDDIIGKTNWNTTIPKIIDNAIILKINKSTKK